MTETLLTIPPETPRWQELADLHGITWIKEDCGDDGAADWFEARISWFGVLETSRGQTEKEAVVALLHRLELTGWKTVSIG